MFVVIAAALVVCASGALAHCGHCGKDKKEGKCEEHKCCIEAKKAGKTCEKCAAKEEKKEEKK
jgi:hypothetical protein